MIYIFYPSHILGGAELLLIRLANDLHAAGYVVCIIDIKNGWISKNIENVNIKILYLTNKKLILSDDGILITTANYLYSLDRYFSPSKTKLLFWTVQPYNVIIRIPHINKINFFKKLPLDFIKEFYLNIVLKARLKLSNI